MLRYEISHLVDPEKYFKFFIFVPTVYISINFITSKIMEKIKNWYLLCVVILSAQIILTIVETVVVLNYSENELTSFVLFAINVALFQKVVFLSINTTMLQIFDIDNLRVRNYLSCNVKSNCQ